MSLLFKEARGYPVLDPREAILSVFITSELRGNSFVCEEKLKREMSNAEVFSSWSISAETGMKEGGYEDAGM